MNRFLDSACLPAGRLEMTVVKRFDSIRRSSSLEMTIVKQFNSIILNFALIRQRLILTNRFWFDKFECRRLRRKGGRVASARQVLERSISRTMREIEKIARAEKRAREKWTKFFQRHLAAAKQLRALKNVRTKKAARLGAIIDAFDAQSAELTRRRDELRAQMKEKEQARVTFEKQLAVLVAQTAAVCDQANEIVGNVFRLNDDVLRALAARQEYLSTHVFSRLFDANGKMKSQVTFDSACGLRRVVVLVNHITKVDPDLANQALLEVDNFFARVRPRFEAPNLAPEAKALYDLTEKLLIIRETFKVGPDLYRFIGIEIDEAVFPELYRAQMLLRRSLRSEKTTSYVRLYRRLNRQSAWEPIETM